MSNSVVANVLLVIQTTHFFGKHVNDPDHLME